MRSGRKIILGIMMISCIYILQSHQASASLPGDIIGTVTDILPPTPISSAAVTANYPPGATDDYAETEMDTDVTIDVLANDSDPNGDDLITQSISIWPENGDVIINDDGTITYTPNSGFVGTDTFDYKVTDGNGGSDTAQVTVDVMGETSVNNPPGATDDYAQTDIDTDVTIDVLANDSDDDGDDLITKSITIWPQNGDATINDDGTITYTPNEGFTGTDSFDYKVVDGRGGHDTAQVTIDVIDSTGSSTESTLLVKSTDLAGSAFSGQWIEVWQNDKIIKQGYTPFSYTLQTGAQYNIHIYDDTAENKFFDHWNDGNINSTITITPSSDITLTAFFKTSITPTNNPPDAVPDQAQTKMNTPVKINVLANDVDSDGDALTISAISTNPQKGSTAINSDKTITYTPNNEFVGADSFSYKISDGKGGEDIAQVTINVLNVIRNITQTKSGLVAIDPLNNETKTMQQLKANQKFWNYGGSAESLYEPDAPFEYFKDSEGLHVGVQSPQQGNYSGYYAVTSLPNATLFHSIIGTTTRTIPAGDFQNGLYVQENIFGNVDYLTCVSIANSGGTTWQLVFAQGNQIEANQFKLLWKDSNPNPSLTRDCTIVTNGVNYLKLYMDGVKVYENTTMNLQMPTPFSYFLEPQTSYAGSKLFGVYRDFYATTSEFVKLVNIPSNADRVDLIGTTGTVLASSPVAGNTATIDVGAYHFPLAAGIKVYDSSNNEIASTTGQASIYGGNIYTVNAP